VEDTRVAEPNGGGWRAAHLIARVCDCVLCWHRCCVIATGESPLQRRVRAARMTTTSQRTYKYQFLVVHVISISEGSLSRLRLRRPCSGSFTSATVMTSDCAIATGRSSPPVKK
jgi:hypothetical protein